MLGLLDEWLEEKTVFSNNLQLLACSFRGLWHSKAFSATNLLVYVQYVLLTRPRKRMIWPTCTHQRFSIYLDPRLIC
jgi:hypothetical protein